MCRDNMEIVGIFLFSLLLTICHARFISIPRQARLSLAEPMPYYFHNDIDGHPGTYSYGYDVADPATGNNQFRTEERYPNGTVIGSYGYVDAWGRPQRYRYIADEKGYRVMRDRPSVWSVPSKEPAPSVPYPSYLTPAESSRPLRPSESYPVESSVTWNRPPRPSESYPVESSVTWNRPPRPSESYPVESSVTWTRPKRPNKKKNNNYYVNRPTGPIHNFIGSPSSYAED